ncbi:CopD family protein [Rhodoblastus sp.]|uniref:CopD family protein n=1 Tax=Rhodoblastus sp. TaxID=1962975 RepID=UPI0026191CF1|nr:CopD family protein [Rhodoblastus sp.]
MNEIGSAEGSETFPLFSVLVLARWIHFASVFVLFGSAFFWFYVTDGFVRARSATNVLLRVAALVAAASGLLWLAAIVADMAGGGIAKAVDPETLSVFFFQTQFGAVAALRLVLLAAAVVLALAPGAGKIWLSAHLHVGALLLVNQAWLGHAAVGGDGLWGAFMLCVYCIHVIAAAAWVGGLPPLLFALRETRGRGDDETRRRTLAILLRFSVMAFPAVALIVASGLGNVGFRVGASFGQLFLTEYGFVLCVKATLFVAMLALAGYNRFVALPRLRLGPPSAAQNLRLHASVALELALGVCAIGAAAALGITPPPQ